MTQKKLHPSVEKFKEFVKNNPKIIKEVRKGNATWQELYEDWYLLGEEDQRWEKIGSDGEAAEVKDEKEAKGDLMSNVMGIFKKMDPNQMQSHLQNISQAIGAIQGLVSQFQGGNAPNNPVKPPEGPKHPFTFRQD
ncbi:MULTISPECIES: YlbD family protein [Neobacillus]|uniref:YlbD family protein n=1 Tax=Neobacillus citreus TaxID=2833578 RepID=A0A942Y896_9BACI|nr:YlbD family protein [Neobacillus citreus]MCH6265765.1 YlbD family protein [Neobacillus citreus]